MKPRLILIILLSALNLCPEVGTAAEPCTQRNGDVNADGRLSLLDGITILSHVFAGRPAELPQVCESARPPRLPATGQTKCYDEAGNEIPCDSPTCPGQDGFYRAGCPMEGRYVDHGDGTVSDTCTGLMWQKDSDIGSDMRFDCFVWYMALDHCEDLTLAGYNDWRLPNVRELESILDYSRGRTGVEPPWDPVFRGLPWIYWSSTPSSLDPWFVAFWGASVCNDRTGYDCSSLVRAVREGARCSATNGDVDADGHAGLTDALAVLGHVFLFQPRDLPPFCETERHRRLPATGRTTCAEVTGGGTMREIPCGGAICPGQDGDYQTGCPIEGRFFDHGDGTVSDACTRLMWAKDAADTNGDGVHDRADRVTWREALFYCEGLSFASYDDWRLPNARELQSIFNYESRGLAALPPAFGGSPFGGWTSTSSSLSPTNAWMVPSCAFPIPKDQFQPVRPVRGGL